MEHARKRRGGRSWLWSIVGLLVVTPVVAEVEWRDSTRDVWIDGRADRNAQVLVHEGEIAVLSGALPWIVVFHVESLDVRRMDKDDLRLAEDRASATSSVPAAPIDGIVERIEGSDAFIVVARERQIIVAPHRGLTGEVGQSELWQHAPVWRSLAGSHEPEAETLEALGRVDRNVEATVYFGTWCGDSKRAVPRLLKTLQSAGNPRIALRLVALSRGMAEPLVRENRLTNVPTVVVSSGGEEIGRIVETPAGDSFASDLAAILDGAEVADHPGRWKRGESLARGKYAYSDPAGAPFGEESWELWAAEEGGRLLRSQIRRGDGSIELWQRRDATGKTEFVEVTRHSTEGHSRSRHWIEEGKLRALTRGDTTGIVDQELSLPGDAAVLLPAAVTAGQVGRLSDGPGSGRLALRVPGSAGPAFAGLVTVEITTHDLENVETPMGSFRAQRIRHRVGDEFSDWWLHPELGIPLVGKLANGESVMLQELEVTGEPNGSL